MIENRDLYTGTLLKKISYQTKTLQYLNKSEQSCYREDKQNMVLFHEFTRKNPENFPVCFHEILSSIYISSSKSI